jgi:hypothetical protein
MIRQFLLIAGFCLLAFVSKTNAQQAALETFGQNRLQNRVFRWQYYDSAHFRVMYYDYGKHNAQYVIQQAEADFPKLLAEMGVRMPRKINIVLYNSYTDYKQTNTGRYNEELSTSSNSVVDISGNTVVVYFNGNHDDLRKQVKQGVANIIKDNLLFGFKLKDIVQNAIKLRLPLWYTAGYVDYESSKWDGAKESKVQRLIANGGKRTNFDYLAEQNPKIIGQSFFHYIEKQYGKNFINNLFYLTSSRKSINKSLEITLRKPAKEIYKEWKDFYAGQPEDTDGGIRKLMFSLKPKADADIRGFALSPDGTQMAYCESRNGTYNVMLYTTQSNKSVVILEGGIKNSLVVNDPSYPIMAWNNDGKKMAIMYEREYEQRLKVYDAKTGRISDRVILPNKFDRLNGLAFMDDDDKLVLSAIRKGQCDIYQYTIKNAMLVNITKDIWDEGAPRYINTEGMKGVVFMSNRPLPKTVVEVKNGELPNSNPNIYFYNDETGSTNLLQITKEDDVKLSMPIQYGVKDIAFLAEVGGKNKRIIAHHTHTAKGKDSVYYTMGADIKAHIAAHGYNHSKKICFDVIEAGKELKIFATPLQDLVAYEESTGLSTTTYTSLKQIANIAVEDKKDETSTFFLSDFENDVDSIVLDKPNKQATANGTAQAPANAKSIIDQIKFKAKTYTTTFNTDFLQTSLDNNFIFHRYQNLNTGNKQLATPPLGALLKINLFDYLEDYKLTAAFRIPLQERGSAWQLKFANYRRRLDWEVQLLNNTSIQNVDLRRDTVNYSPFEEQLKQTQTYIQGMVSYPFSVTTSLRFFTGLRQDRLRYKAGSDYSIRFPATNEYWQFNRLEYVYDNTTNPFVNIKKGTRVKVYQDAYFRIFGNNGNMLNSGIDVRHYLPIFRNTIFAVRLNTATSYGTSRMLYRLGGVDNAIMPTQYGSNTDYSNSLTTTYGFQSQVTSMRGYHNNARQGSSFAVLTSEVRVPIVNTFLQRTVRSKFMNSLQLVPFIDAGAVGTDFLSIPSVDTRTVYAENKSASMVSFNSLTTTIQGIGLGARAQISSYFIRLDVAKGVDRTSPLWHISLSEDF